MAITQQALEDVDFCDEEYLVATNEYVVEKKGFSLYCSYFVSHHHHVCLPWFSIPPAV